MKGEELRQTRRKTMLSMWALAHILHISGNRLSEMEKGLKPIPFDLELKIHAEIARQQQKFHYGSARNIITNLLGEGYSLATLASLVGTKRVTVRKWQIQQATPTPAQLQTLVELPPPVKIRRKPVKHRPISRKLVKSECKR